MGRAGYRCWGSLLCWFFLFHFNQAQFKNEGICWDGKNIGVGVTFVLVFFFHLSQAQLKDGF